MTTETVTTTEPVVEKPTHVVIDNSNLDAVLANARGQEYKPEEKKEEPKAETKVEAKEDDDGLTEEQRATFTENMKRTIGKKHRAQKEAEELAEEQYNTRILAERRAEALERENKRLKEQLTPPKQEEGPKKPNKADFKSDEEYIEAVADYRAELKIKEREDAAHAAALEERQREVIATAEQRIAKARETVPDFDEVLKDNDTQVPPAVAAYMQESDLFAELAYYFGKNTEELEKISKLSPPKQLVAIGKIESTLKPFSEKPEKDEAKAATPQGESKNGKAVADPSTNGKSPSKARTEPIQPLETGSSSQVEKPVSEMSFQEYKAYWQKKNKVNLSARKRH